MGGKSSPRTPRLSRVALAAPTPRLGAAMILPGVPHGRSKPRPWHVTREEPQACG